MRQVPWIIVALAVAACGSPPPPQYGAAAGPAGGGAGGPRPQWVDGVSGRYSDIQYLTGVGHGSGRSQCESDAFGALAKIFNARIHQVSQDWQSYFSQVGNMSPGVKVEAMDISQLTRISTDKVLKGVRVAEHYEEQSTHHCLAVLERMPAARSLREEIGRLDAEMLAQLKRGDEATTPTARFMAYARAMEMMQEREALNVDLRIVDNRGRGMPPPHKWEELVAKFHGSKARIKVGLKVTGSKGRKFQVCLAQALTQQGIEVLEGTSDVDLMIHGSLKFSKAGRIAGSVMVRCDVNLRVTDIENGRTLAAFSENTREGRPTLRRAIQLTETSLCKKTAPKLAVQIRSSFKR